MAHVARALTRREGKRNPAAIGCALGNLHPDRLAKYDLRVRPGSPAVNAGVEVPKDWPDPACVLDEGKPDIRAVPLGAEVWRIGVRGRLSPFAEEMQSR